MRKWDNYKKTDDGRVIRASILPELLPRNIGAAVEMERYNRYRVEIWNKRTHAAVRLVYAKDRNRSRLWTEQRAKQKAWQYAHDKWWLAEAGLWDEALDTDADLQAGG